MHFIKIFLFIIEVPVTFCSAHSRRPVNATLKDTMSAPVKQQQQTRVEISESAVRVLITTQELKWPKVGVCTK